MRMRDVLWQIWLNCGYFLTVAASGFFLYKLCAPFVRPRNGRFWRVLLFLTLAGSTGMVIWIGDPNLLYTLPVYFALFLLATRGDWVGRLAVCIILFCLEMSVCALLDTYVERINRNALYDVLVRLARPLVFGPLWLLLRRRLPRRGIGGRRGPDGPLPVPSDPENGGADAGGGRPFVGPPADLGLRRVPAGLSL